MAKITNNLNLPAAIVQAVLRDPYTKGDSEFSVTELLQPPRARALKIRHADQIEEDVADVIYRLMGQLGHLLLERAGSGSDDICERRFFAMIDGHRVSGQADLVKVDGRYACNDYKFTSHWTVVDGVKPEWIAQLNALRLLAKLDVGIEIEALNNIAIYRDWSKRQARRSRRYPQKPIGVFSVPVWSYEETYSFLAHRIRLHLAAEKELPECTASERWAKPDLYKCKKKAGGRAVPGGIFENFSEAQTFAGERGLLVEASPAESIRCEDYCEVAPFCLQFQSTQTPQETE